MSSRGPHKNAAADGEIGASTLRGNRAMTEISGGIATELILELMNPNASGAGSATYDFAIVGGSD